jgi:hypothetical protein
MTNRILVAAVFLVGCAVGGVSSQLVVPKASAQQAATLTKWDYHCREPEPTATEMARAMGAEGWEMVTVRAETQSIGSHDVYCFKRPKM